EPILLYKGIIYEYVEDECVVSWPMTNGLKNANCIHSVLELLNVINKNKEQYVNSYGYVPEINAALHCGPIIQAEVGSLKSDIAFYGDVMNVTSRILNKCPELGSQVLISEELFEQLPPSNLFKLKSKGEFKLKGKTDSIDLFSLAL
ncbi:MAG: adenylate/guanylate cyclase domain-containing protein, partial [Bacteroidota bacterium]